MLHFTKEESEVRKHALPFVPARYIRTLDVIGRRISKTLAFVLARYI